MRGVAMRKVKMVQRADRAKTLESLRTAKMARSAHAYVRGNTARFYEWLDTLDRGTLPEGPPVWICGDCHLGNLGPLADAEGDVRVQIRDLDQTVIGNPAHDLVRLGLSLASAARGSDLPGVVTTRMLEEMVRGYATGLLDAPGAMPEEPDVVRTVRVRALGRRWKHLARERIKDVEPSIPWASISGPSTGRSVRRSRRCLTNRKSAASFSPSTVARRERRSGLWMRRTG